MASRLDLRQAAKLLFGMWLNSSQGWPSICEPAILWSKTEERSRGSMVMRLRLLTQGCLVRFPRSTSHSDETLNRSPRLRITFLCLWDVKFSWLIHSAIVIWSSNHVRRRGKMTIHSKTGKLLRSCNVIRCLWCNQLLESSRRSSHVRATVSLTHSPLLTTIMPCTNSLDPDETPSISASHPDASCLTLKQQFHWFWATLKHFWNWSRRKV